MSQGHRLADPYKNYVLQTLLKHKDLARLQYYNSLHMIIKYDESYWTIMLKKLSFSRMFNNLIIKHIKIDVNGSSYFWNLFSSTLFPWQPVLPTFEGWVSFILWHVKCYQRVHFFPFNKSKPIIILSIQKTNKSCVY